MDPIVTAALVGTAQRGSPAIVSNSPADALVRELPPGDAERALLLRAGCAAVYTRAGALSDILPDLPEAAPADTLSACSPAAAHLLEQLLSDDREPRDTLLVEAVERMRRAGLRLPYDLLPAALSLASRRAYLRDDIASVAGERGRWLSRFRPDWSWLADELAEQAEIDLANAAILWREGTTPRRVAVLRRLRTDNPATARDWLATDWKREPAEARTILLNTLRKGLSLADEPFLERALDDRSAEVRTLAASLLGLLPGSALAARMRDRADTLLSFTDGALEITPLQALDKAAIRDGIPEKPRNGDKRAAWLARILGCVPLPHWEERFQASREQLLAARIASEWQTAVLEGFCSSAISFATTEWALPLWQHSFGRLPSMSAYFELTASLFRLGLTALVPARDVEAYVKTLASDNTISWSEAVRTVPAPWSEDFGDFFLARLRDYAAAPVTQDAYDSQVYAAISHAAMALPPACFPSALASVQPNAGTSPLAQRLNRDLDTFAETLRLRQRILEVFPL